MSIGYRIKRVNTPVRVKFGPQVRVGDRVEIDEGDPWPRRFGRVYLEPEQAQEPETKAEHEPPRDKSVKRPSRSKRHGRNATGYND